MKISWLGHASFLIESGNMRLITDPFDENLGYPVYEQAVDAATVSHEHWDHNATDKLKGTPRVVRGPGHFELDNYSIEGFPSCHDKSGGSERGKNTIYKISAEGIDLLHLGDLGQILTDRQLAAMGAVDILMVPVGGKFTINAREAYDLVIALKPRVVIPMHYNTPHLSFELAPVEEFSCKFDRVIKKPFLEITETGLNEPTEVIILDYLHWLTSLVKE